jgi:hypothetical protein
METPVPSAILDYTWRSLKRVLMGFGAALVLGLAILFVSLWVVTQTDAAEAQPTPTTAASPSAQKIEYYLPYPGILPDSPLFKLKAFRDRIRLEMTFNIEKKAEMELLLADKRLNAAQALIDGGKQALGVTTVTKAEKYLEQSASHALALRASGHDAKSLLGMLGKASAKHLEIIQQLGPKVTPAQLPALNQSMDTAQGVLQSVNQALMEK